ncbi:MAG: hypothetical protein ACEQSL_03750 [Sediminibacterium sp.]
MKGWLYILSNNTRGYVRVLVSRRGMFLMNTKWNIKYPMSEKKIHINRIRTFDNTKFTEDVACSPSKMVEYKGGIQTSIN